MILYAQSQLRFVTAINRPKFKDDDFFSAKSFNYKPWIVAI